jgi:hypothetical protein
MDIPELIRTDPEEARRALREAFLKSGALQREAALLYQVGPWTFCRWVAQLGLSEEFKQLTMRAKREGWISPVDQRGKRGPDRQKRAPRTKRKGRRTR